MTENTSTEASSKQDDQATEFEFTLPHGINDAQGDLHRVGIMRLVSAYEEIEPLVDLRVQKDPAYLNILLLSGTVTRIGSITDVGSETIEQLSASDLAYLQAFYEKINAFDGLPDGHGASPAEGDQAAEFEFTLPRGLKDAQGTLHRQGRMRLATDQDEIEPLDDSRVRRNPAYLGIVLFSRVVTRIGSITDVDSETIEQLFASDLAYLRAFYEKINNS